MSRAFGGEPGAHRSRRAFGRRLHRRDARASIRHFLAEAGVDPRIIRAAALLSGPYDFYPFTEQRGRDALWPVAAAEGNPADHLRRRDAPPMLLMHGTADTVVQPRNSRTAGARR